LFEVLKRLLLGRPLRSARLGDTLLVDYVMTVAVSVVSGVVAITSAIRSLAPHAVLLSVGFVVVLVLANLRGTTESGRVFAVPTYAFIGLTLLMFAVAAVKGLHATLPLAESAADAAVPGGELPRPWSPPSCWSTCSPTRSCTGRGSRCSPWSCCSS
jgi:amino acid transporter